MPIFLALSRAASLSVAVSLCISCSSCSPYGVLCHGAAGSPCASPSADGGAPAHVCGDGIREGEEACDDGADGDADDGCRDDCRLSCESSLDCLDGERCNGAELCDRETHRCLAAQPFPDGAACRRHDDSRGVCRAARCVSPGCGNGVVERVEECDDGNRESGDGCGDDCTFTCREDPDCDDEDPCNGEERCDEGTHRCVPGETLHCDDADRCTVDYCDPRSGCAARFIDLDGDGFAPSSLGRCVAAPGRSGDCQDEDPRVHPRQLTWFGVPYASRAEAWSWDYDCDGDQTLGDARVTLGACGTSEPCEGGGWVGTEPVRCGGSGPFVDCRVAGEEGGSACAVAVTERVQLCR